MSDRALSHAMFECDSKLYLPNYLNRVIKVRVSDHRISDAPVTVRCDDANAS